MTPPSHAELSTSPYEVSHGAVALLLRLNLDARSEYGWGRAGDSFRLLTSVVSGQPRSWNVLGHGGTSLAFEDFDPRPTPVDPWGEFASIGPHVLDLTDGRARGLQVPPLEGFPARIEFAVGPDGRVAVADNVLWAPEGRTPTGRDGLLSVRIATPGTAQSREVFRRQAGLWAAPFDRPLQWSPDGSRIALSITDLSGDPMRPIPTQVLLLDAATGEVGRALEDVTIAGSASWTPDSSRLLVVDGEERVMLADTDTGALLHPSRPLQRGPGGRRRWDVVGAAGNNHLLVFHQRGRTGRLAALDLTDGEEREIVSWRGDLDMYVTAAQMPEGYWT